MSEGEKSLRISLWQSAVPNGPWKTHGQKGVQNLPRLETPTMRSHMLHILTAKLDPHTLVLPQCYSLSPTTCQMWRCWQITSHYEANALYLSAAVVAKEDSCSIYKGLSIRPAPQLHLSMQAAPTYMYLSPVFDMKKATWSVRTVHVARENSQKPLVSFWRKQDCTGLTGDCCKLQEIWTVRTAWLHRKATGVQWFQIYLFIFLFACPGCYGTGYWKWKSARLALCLQHWSVLAWHY